MSYYSYDRRAADRVPPSIVPVTRFFGRNREAYARFLESKTGVPWEGSTWTGKGVMGDVTIRFYSKSDEPTNRVEVEIKVNPISFRGDDPEQLLNVRVDATRHNRSLAYVYHDKVKADIFKTPHNVMPDSFFENLNRSMGGSYEKELGEIQNSMANIMSEHKELDTHLAEVERMVKEDPVKNYVEIERLAREASYKAGSVERSLKYLPDSIKVVVEKK